MQFAHRHRKLMIRIQIWLGHSQILCDPLLWYTTSDYGFHCRLAYIFTIIHTHNHSPNFCFVCIYFISIYLQYFGATCTYYLFGMCRRHPSVKGFIHRRIILHKKMVLYTTQICIEIQYLCYYSIPIQYIDNSIFWG